MKKIIIKSALTTLGIVLGCAVVVFAVLSFGFPSTMAGWCEQVGNYSFAVKYASLYYSYTGDIEDLARCAEDSVLSEKDDYVTKYCVKLIDDSDFDEYCAMRDNSFAQLYPDISFSYRQYMYGTVACSYYRQNDLNIAIGFAVEALDADFDRTEFVTDGDNSFTINEFPVNNALGTLSLCVIKNKDASSGAEILEVLDMVSPANEEQQTYLDTLSGALSGLY